MLTLTACCPAGGGGGSSGHRRGLQGGCSGFPASCSVECAELFVEYYGVCQDLITAMPATEKEEFDSFYGQCSEAAQVAAAMIDGASPAMIYHVLVISPVGRGEPPAPSPPPATTGGSVAAQEFRRVCTTANLATCVPACNAVTYGFLLSIEIDGKGTVMTCNVMDGLFAWVGQASLGGFIGTIFAAFFASVNSGAGGTYMITMTEGQNVQSDLTIQAGQVVVVGGDERLAVAPAWGSGSITVQQFGSLSLAHISCIGALLVAGGGMLALSDCDLAASASLTAHGTAALASCTVDAAVSQLATLLLVPLKYRQFISIVFFYLTRV